MEMATRNRMAPALVTINSQNHHTKLIDGLRNLFLTKNHVDFNLTLGRRSIGAHRLLLNMFLSARKLQNIAAAARENKNGNRDLLESLLEFLYTGRVNVARKQLDSLLVLAKNADFGLLVESLQLHKRSTGSPKREKRNNTAGVSRLNKSTEAKKGFESKIYPDTKQCSVEVRRLPRQIAQSAVTRRKRQHSAVSLRHKNDRCNSSLNAKLVEANPGLIGSESRVRRRKCPRVCRTCTTCSNAKPNSTSDAKTNDESDDAETDATASETDNCTEDEFDVARPKSTRKTKTSNASDGMRIVLTSAESDNDSDDATQNSPNKKVSDDSVDQEEDMTSSEDDDTADNNFAADSESESDDDSDVSDFEPAGKRKAAQRKPKIAKRQTELVDDGPHKCSDCGSVFRNRKRLWRHQNSLRNVSDLKCNVCKEVCLTHCSFALHKRDKHTGRSEKVSHDCQHCDETFQQWDDLIKHSRAAHSDSAFNCSECCGIKRFKTLNSLNNHHRIYHEDRPQLLCNLCPKIFFRERDLKRHKMFHDRSDKCKVGTKKLKSDATLKEQDQINHKGLERNRKRNGADRPFVCECGEKFNGKWSLAEHRKAHNDSSKVKLQPKPSQATNVEPSHVHNDSSNVKLKPKSSRPTNVRSSMGTESVPNYKAVAVELEPDGAASASASSGAPANRPTSQPISSQSPPKFDPWLPLTMSDLDFIRRQIQKNKVHSVLDAKNT